MSNSNSYVAELEYLIVYTLLPLYEKHCEDNDLQNTIDPKLLQQLKRRKVVAALLRPREN